jgi:hypothetical protein
VGVVEGVVLTSAEKEELTEMECVTEFVRVGDNSSEGECVAVRVAVLLAPSLEMETLWDDDAVILTTLSVRSLENVAVRVMVVLGVAERCVTLSSSVGVGVADRVRLCCQDTVSEDEGVCDRGWDEVVDIVSSSVDDMVEERLLEGEPVIETLLDKEVSSLAVVEALSLMEGEPLSETLRVTLMNDDFDNVDDSSRVALCDADAVGVITSTSDVVGVTVSELLWVKSTVAEFWDDDGVRERESDDDIEREYDGVFVSVAAALAVGEELASSVNVNDGELLGVGRGVRDDVDDCDKDSVSEDDDDADSVKDLVFDDSFDSDPADFDAEGVAEFVMDDSPDWLRDMLDDREELACSAEMLVDDEYVIDTSFDSDVVRLGGLLGEYRWYDLVDEVSLLVE